MKTLLIAGMDTVVGINLAAHLAERFQVVGVCLRESAAVPGCHSGLCLSQEENDVREWVESIRPDHVVYCGPAAHSTWDDAAIESPDVDGVDVAGRWAAAAHEYGARLTVVSTDGVFTGPWVYHEEDSTCHCSSREARSARRIEKTAAVRCPDALIVRTNAFGWSHTDGWIERTLAALEDGTAGPFDFLRHATPILATDFAEVLSGCWEANLGGIYHVSGAERTNPNQFVHRLADEFGLPAPRPVDGNQTLERPRGFGCGESALHTTKIRKALGIAMPTLGDALQRLREQKRNGAADGLKAPLALEKVA
ncbi:MAG: sugar nucleotide-binding protein [Planctomycetaceae bacterium]